MQNLKRTATLRTVAVIALLAGISTVGINCVGIDTRQLGYNYPAATSTQSPTPTSTSTPAPASSSPMSVLDGDILTDGRDFKKYKTVVIGGQRWMGENLNYKTSSDSWCYGNDISNCDKYGRLYSWNAAMAVCPRGWHLPSREEWGNLAKAAGGTGEYGSSGMAGKKLKAKNYWNLNGIETDVYGFSALPGGRASPGYPIYFEHIGNYGSWWTSTESSKDYAYRRYMGYDYYDVGEHYYDKRSGFSVRCVADK